MAISGTYTAPRTLAVGDDVTVPIWHTDIRDNIAVLYEWAVKGAVTPKTSAYTATIADQTVIATSGTWTLTLYAVAGNDGRHLYVKNAGAGLITIDGAGAETIDGAATYSLDAGVGVLLRCDGARWVVALGGAGGVPAINDPIWCGYTRFGGRGF